ncbi:MAG: TldD/PmbA family protein [Candidatus Thorarchaeota archaeon]
MNHQLIELGTHVVDCAEALGANQVEAYLESTKIIEVKIERGLIRLAAEKQDAGCGIRVALGNQLGISYVTSILEKDLDQAIRDAIAASRASVPDPDFKSFASVRSSYPKISGIFDRQIDQIGYEQAVEIMKRAVQASQEVSGKERNLIVGGFTAESKTRVIVNSHGINATSCETKAGLEVYSAIGSGGEQCSSDEIQGSRRLAAIDPEKVGSQSARYALELRGAKAIDGGDLPLILSPRALLAVLREGFTKALNARTIQEGKSYMVDSLGSEIATSELSIMDTGVQAYALGSRPFDAEGFPSQNTQLVGSGILKSYLHDSYSSAKDEVDDTGNAARGSYRVTPSIDISNLVISPGSSSLDEMISEVSKGVLCTLTLDRPNPITGELSAMIMEGFFLSKGEIIHPLKSTLFGITMTDLLKRIILIGSDIESRENMISPSILVESAKITSG